MNFLGRFQIIDDTDKSKAAQFLVERATPDFDFFFMMTLSVVMACAGLMLGSETIVIGSMLIAPLLYPVLGIAMGVSMGDFALLRRSVQTVTKAAGFAIAVSVVAGLFAASQYAAVELTPEIILRTKGSLLLLGVAIVSGLAVSYALVRPRLSEALAGIAISVALLPPLAVVGLGLAWLNLPVAIGALMVFLLNILGIVGAALLNFSLMDIRETKPVVAKTMSKEEERIDSELEEIEKINQKQ